MIAGSAAAGAAGALLYAVAPDTTWVFAVTPIFGVAMGVATTRAYTAAGGVIPASARGASFGLLSTASLTGLAVSPIVSGFLGATSIRAVFLLDTVALVIVGFLVSRLMIDRASRKDADSGGGGVVIRLSVDPIRPDPAAIAAAVDVLRRDGIVAYPTDTLYGLAVDPRRDPAVERLFEVKARDPASAVALIAVDVAQAQQAGSFGANELALARALWPGPLTIVVAVSDRDVERGERRSGDRRRQGAGTRGGARTRRRLRVVHHRDECEPLGPAGRHDRRRSGCGVRRSHRRGARCRTGAGRAALDHRGIQRRASRAAPQRRDCLGPRARIATVMRAVASPRAGTPPSGERAALVGLFSSSRAGSPRRFDPEHSLDELAGLSAAAGATVVLRLLQERARPDPASFLGSGKVATLAAACDETHADVVIFDNELSPAQLRNLERSLDRKVVDRTQLILDIFARRARTREGKLQVELAQLKYSDAPARRRRQRTLEARRRDRHARPR